jgi:hypothetical protein
MRATRVKLLLAGLPVLIVALTVSGAYVFWKHMTQPLADVRRSTLTVLPVSDTVAKRAPADESVDVRPHELPRIEPGTVIPPKPAGGTRIVLHSVPRVTEGDIAKVPSSLSRLVSLFHLTILADVVPDPSIKPAHYRLTRVAVGLATETKGREMIVSTKTLGQFGPKLGFVERSSLAGNEASLDQALQVARTPTMVVFDATAIQRIAGRNQHVIHRHAVLVSPTDGKLQTFVWALERDDAGQYHLVDGKVRRLANGAKEDRKLYVDAGLFTFGLPSQEAFALVDLPPGDDLAMSPQLQRGVESTLQTADDCLGLERLLRSATAATVAN